MGPLKFAVIEITNRCNLRCPHCASTSGGARSGELTFDEIDTLLGDIRALGGEEITIIGGEALMRDDWYEICQSVTAHGMRLILISNGIRMNFDETVARLNALEPYLIGISIDGATRESYRRHRGVDRFDHVVALLKRLKAEGHREVNAITTFMRTNLVEFDTFADLFENTGITWQVQLANKGGRRFDDGLFLTLEDFAYFVAKMTDAFSHRKALKLRHMDDFGYCPIDPALRFLHQTFKGCIAGRSLIGVRSNGDVMGCLSLGDGFEEANLREAPIEEIWHSGKYFERFRNKAAYLKGHCRTCPAADVCRAGCTSIAVSATSDIGENPYCIRRLESRNILSGLELPTG
jgi:radical SAM protein with 4Fe4S-binding SPASM domain